MSLIPPRVDSIALPVADVARSTRFYRDTMGFEQLPSSDSTFRIDGEDVPAADAIVPFRLGNVVIVVIDRRLLAVEMNVDDLPRPGACSLGIRVAREDVERYMNRLAAAGVQVLAPAQEQGPLLIGFAADPDGHVWEIIQDPTGGQEPSENAA